MFWNKGVFTTNSVQETQHGSWTSALAMHVVVAHLPSMSIISFDHFRHQTRVATLNSNNYLNIFLVYYLFFNLGE